MKNACLFLFMLFAGSLPAQEHRPQVLTLGTFHFAFPNLDAQQVADSDRIDVLQPRYQTEIEDIVERMARFAPTVIVIERQPGEQHTIDSLYAAFLVGRHELGRGEEEQLGFRLAKRFQLKTLHCVDEWGRFTPNIDSLFNGTDSLGALRFEAYFAADPDSALRRRSTSQVDRTGILGALREANDPAHIERDLGNYLIGLFKYEAVPGDFTGVDFESGRWFNRNLRIFRNIQRIPVTPEDRILVIYGAGHLNVLNMLFRSSPEYRFVGAEELLR